MPTDSRIFITGLGLVTALGNSAWQTFAALRAGKTISQRTAALPTDVAAVDLVRAVGCVARTVHGAGDPAVELAETACLQALAEAGVDGRGMVAYLGTSKGAVHSLLAAAQMHQAGDAAAFAGSARHAPLDPRPRRPLPQAELAVTLGPHGLLTHLLRQRLDLGPAEHVVAACASSLTALHLARQRLLHDPSIQRILVATSEAALAPLFIHSYRRLGVLAPLTPPERYRCLPLDQDRCGFVLAEAAAAVVLERARSPQELWARQGRAAAPTGSRAAALELVDTAVACEAYDLVQSPTAMPALDQVARQLLAGQAIDLIHPHAPGTADHDAAELAIYARHLPQGADVYACKGALGHTLGAAGLAALVLAGLCARTGSRPPMPWLTRPLATLNPQALAPAPRLLSRQAIFAAGFAGHVAGAVLQRSEN